MTPPRAAASSPVPRVLRTAVSGPRQEASVPPAIVLDNVVARFGELRALYLPRLEVRPGERLFVLGHSGSGKTTLARLIKGRLAPAAGRLRVLGQDPADPAQRRALARRVAMIDQEFHLVPRLRVVDNVLHGCLGRVPAWRSLVGLYPAAEWRRAESILDEVGLGGLGERRVDTLSGGQRQRTAIARALMQQADVILADEPVSNLDPELAEDALELLVGCVARRGVTLIVNLHQPELAKRFASRLVGLADGELVFDGPPEAFTAEDAQRVYRSGRPARSSDDQLAPGARAAAALQGLRLAHG